MASKKTTLSKRPKLSDISRKNDAYSFKSREHLRFLLYNEIKAIFVGSLNAIENRLGKNFEAFAGLRAEILRLGNNAIRNCHEHVDKFNVEMIPDTTRVVMPESQKE